jgi:hypothetical protein
MNRRKQGEIPVSAIATKGDGVMNIRNLLAACLFCGSALMLSAQQPVPPPPRPAYDAPANAAVLKLLQVGMPESVVLDKIHAITDKFDTSIDALVTLKQAGATEAELKAIMAQGSDQSSAIAPAASGPPLAETMQFIQAKLNDIGKVTFALFVQDSSDNSSAVVTITSETSNFVADQSQCRVSYHQKSTNNGKVKVDADSAFLLRDVQEIVIRPHEQWQSEWFAKNGYPTATAVSTNPPTMQLNVRLPRGQETFFLFTDANMADRVAKAMLHAVELCGGGNKDKF